MKTLPNRTIPEIADGILKRAGITIEDVRRKTLIGRHSAKEEIVWAVAMICLEAKEEGWSYIAIGRYLDRGHDVIMYHCKGRE